MHGCCRNMNKRLVIILAVLAVASAVVVAAIILAIALTRTKVPDEDVFGKQPKILTTRSTIDSSISSLTTSPSKVSSLKLSSTETSKVSSLSFSSTGTSKVSSLIFSSPETSKVSSLSFSSTETSKVSSLSFSTTKSSKASTVSSTTAKTLSDAVLIGNFTILHKTVSAVSDAAICNYLTAVVATVQLNPTNCTILDKRSGSVKVRYRLVFGNVAITDRQRVLTSASSSIAIYSSDISTFIINQSSITFYDDEYGLTPNYCSVLSCHGSNIICIPVVDNYECVCLAGYTKRTASSYSCYNDLGYVSRTCNSTTQFIAKSQVCDEYQDCPDDSDEINCICDSPYQYACKNGRCINGAWLCDGIKDCPLGDDEMFPQCDDCGQSQFRCERPRICISSDKQCDGKIDCPDSSDEARCVSISETQRLTVTYKGTPGYQVCSDSWNQTWSNRICTSMGFGTANSTSFLPSNGSFVSLNLGNPSSNFLASLNRTNCSSKQAVSTSCRKAECGIRTISGNITGPYILNGQRAQRGAWPWQVIVYTGYYSFGTFEPVFLCGGILINDRWILTAAHCTIIKDYDSRFGYTGNTKPQNIQVLLGTIFQYVNPDMIVAKADQVIPHPMYNRTSKVNDIGLIRLSQSVSFSDTVRPICLPDKNQDLSRFKVCVDTGFGTTLRNTDSYYLLQARMNIMSDAECQLYNRIYSNATQLCIARATVLGDTNICSGDSGGPFACQDSNGVWTVIGVNSYGVGIANSDLPEDVCRLSVVARVPALVDWIHNTVAGNSV